MDDTQNAYMKTYSSRVEGYSTRSSRSSTYQYSDRRLDSQNRLSSSRIEAINSSFSGNSLRSSRSNSSLSSIDDMSGSFNSNPRATKFSVVDTFVLDDSRALKWITFITDKRYTQQRQLML